MTITHADNLLIRLESSDGAGGSGSPARIAAGASSEPGQAWLVSAIVLPNTVKAPAGPLSTRVAVTIAGSADDATLRQLVEWAVDSRRPEGRAPVSAVGAQDRAQGVQHVHSHDCRFYAGPVAGFRLQSSEPCFSRIIDEDALALDGIDC